MGASAGVPKLVARIAATDEVSAYAHQPGCLNLRFIEGAVGGVFTLSALSWYAGTQGDSVNSSTRTPP